MPASPIFLSLYGVAFIAVLALAIVLSRRATGTPKQRRAYRAALMSLSHEIGIQHREVDTFFDMADGDIGKTSVRFGFETRGSTPELTIEVLTRGVPENLTLRKLGQPFFDEDVKSGPRQLIGRPELDTELEISGASERWLAAVRSDADALRLLRTLILERRASLLRGRLVLLFPTFPSSAAELRELLVPMLELSETLARPGEPHEGPVLGTPMAGRMRPLRNLRGEERMTRLGELFAAMSDSLGAGQSYPDLEENELEWRGRSDGRPLRIHIDGSGTVELAVKVESRLRNLWFTFDPERGTAERPPKWNEDDTDEILLTPKVEVDGFGASEQRVRERLTALGGGLAKRIPRSMEAEGIRYFRLSSSEVAAMFWPDIHAMRDPEGQILRAVELAGACARAVASAMPPPGDAEEDDVDEEDHDEDEDDRQA